MCGKRDDWWELGALGVPGRLAGTGIRLWDGFQEVLSVVEFSLFAGIECFHGAVIAHDSGVNCAAGAFFRVEG